MFLPFEGLYAEVVRRGLIEELQEKIISSYYQYKGALNKLKDTRARIILYNKNYYL